MDVELSSGSRVYTHYAAAALFLIFGVRMLREVPYVSLHVVAC